jgi:hypothetical protein
VNVGSPEADAYKKEGFKAAEEGEKKEVKKEAKKEEKPKGNSFV